MKKLAYTLAEVLIAVCIVGVISAIMIGLIDKVKPDTNKIKYLKTYDALTKATKTMAKDATLFQHEQIFDSREGSNYIVKLNIHKYPFLDYSEPINPDFHGTDYTGAAKFGNLLKESLGGTAATVPTGATNRFTRPDDTIWTVTTVFNKDGLTGSANDPTDDGHSLVIFYSKITVDLNGDKAPNSTYNSELTKTPDQFVFYVGANGKVKAYDKYGRQYLKTRRALSKKKIEIDDAAPEFDWQAFIRANALWLSDKNVLGVQDTTPAPPEPEPEPEPEPDPVPPDPTPPDPDPVDPIDPDPFHPVHPVFPVLPVYPVKPPIPWSPVVPPTPTPDPDPDPTPTPPTASDYPAMNEAGIRALLQNAQNYATVYGSFREAKNINGGNNYYNGFPEGSYTQNAIKSDAYNNINNLLDDMISTLRASAEQDTSLFKTSSGADNYNVYTAMLKSAKYDVLKYYATVLYYVHDNNSGGSHSYQNYKNEAYRQRLHVYCGYHFDSIIAMLCSGNGYHNGSTYMNDTPPSNTGYDDDQNPSTLEWNLQYGQRSFGSTSDAKSFRTNGFSSNNPESGLIIVEDVWTGPWAYNEYAITVSVAKVREKFIQALKAEYQLAYSKNMTNIQSSTLSNSYKLVTYGASNKYIGWNDNCGSNIFPMVWDN